MSLVKLKWEKRLIFFFFKLSCFGKKYFSLQIKKEKFSKINSVLFKKEKKEKLFWEQTNLTLMALNVLIEIRTIIYRIINQGPIGIRWRISRSFVEHDREVSRAILRYHVTWKIAYGFDPKASIQLDFAWTSINLSIRYKPTRGKTLNMISLDLLMSSNNRVYNTESDGKNCFLVYTHWKLKFGNFKIFLSFVSKKKKVFVRIWYNHSKKYQSWKKNLPNRVVCVHNKLIQKHISTLFLRHEYIVFMVKKWEVRKKENTDSVSINYV